MKRLAKKFAIVILFFTAFVFMLINKTDTVIIEKTSSVATDIVSPIMDTLVIPARAVGNLYDYFRELKQIHQDNKRLMEENARLLKIRDNAISLEIENKILTNLLNYVAPPEATFFTARIVAEEEDTFSHSVIVYTGSNNTVRKGQVALGSRGVVGRVDRVGNMYSRIMLLTDINSKVPVVIERTRVRGILSGDNTSVPKMVFTPLSAEINVGDRVVTSGVAGTFPPGLPVGRVISAEKGNIKVEMFSDLASLEYVKIIDYNLIDLEETE
ncbi:MAG: rod shape-determining protein MreC [Lactobacillus sp.]|jgi:rod shape-determining protein MreC|nr:rod shape-determining protein MreC [Lactobacillus sp.]